MSLKALVDRENIDLPGEALMLERSCRRASHGNEPITADTTTSIKPVFPLSKRQVTALNEKLNTNPDAAVDGHIVARLLRYTEVQDLRSRR